MRKVEFFAPVHAYNNQSTARRGEAADLARRAEDEGWAGVTFGDSQNLASDPYVAMSMAAASTKNIKLATGVTNPSTRHPAVTAAAISSVDVESGGRAELGIGRGDSALGYLGLAPAPLADLKSYLSQLRRYLHGEGVPLSEAAGTRTHRLGTCTPPHGLPTSSRLEWLSQGFPEKPPVPVFVVASGPRVIELAARNSDRVVFAVGGSPERLAWAIDLARGINPEIQVGAYVNVIVHDDQEKALAMGAGLIATFARYSVSRGKISGPVSDELLESWTRLPAIYELTHHGRRANAAASTVGPIAKEFAIAGPAGLCRDRLAELADLGVDRFYILGASRSDQSEEIAEARARLIQSIVEPGLTVQSS